MHWRISERSIILCTRILHAELSDLEEFKIFARVYKELFEIVEKNVTVRKPKDVGSSSLQSPDDLDATYRKNARNLTRDMSQHSLKPASLENKIQLITDVCIDPNNVDGGYGGEGVDTKTEEAGIVVVQTAVKGRESAVEMEIVSDETTATITVSCPLQTVDATKA